MEQGKPKSYRYDIQKAGEVICTLLPDRAALALFASIFVASCRQAHKMSRACWEVTLTPKYLRLNVGPVALLDLEQDHIFLCTLPLQTDPPSGVYYSFSPSEPVYPSVPIPSASLRLSPDRLAQIDATILDSHLRYVTEAAARRSVSAWHYAHSPAALEYLAGIAGIDKPIWQPSYPTDETFQPQDEEPEAEEALKDLFANRHVEERAIEVVQTFYESNGWRVRSVEQEKIGYDLHCTKEGQVKHVEVKGRSRDGEVIILTSQEWNRALEDSCFVLALVAAATTQTPQLHQWAGTEIQTEFEVLPIAFRARKRNALTTNTG